MTITIQTIYGYNKTKKFTSLDWEGIVKSDYIDQSKIKTTGFKFIDKFRKKQIDFYKQNYSKYHNPDKLVHLIMIPMVKESFSIVAETIESIKKNKYDTKNNVIIQICPEERASPASINTALKLQKKFKSYFLDVIVTEHPKGLKGELVGKGGNINFAAKEALKYFKINKIDNSRVLVTTLDADNKIHPQFLSCLSYTYLGSQDPHNASYEPVAFYINNFWDVPAPIRVLAANNTFYTLIKAVRPHLQSNFSSHSQSLLSLIQTNFWSGKSIVEDGHQYYRSFICFKGYYRVVSVFCPVYQDAVQNKSYIKTLKAQFVQLRRWAYGSSDIAYLATRTLIGKNKIKGVPFWPSLVRFLRLLETHVSWGGSTFFLAFAAWMPLILSNNKSATIVYQLPGIVRVIQTIMMVGIIANVYVSYQILPPKPAHYGRLKTISFWLQWTLTPFVGLIYGTISGLSAQFRLLSGRYLESFDVTEKHRTN
jgi:hypothetical protein